NLIFQIILSLSLSIILYFISLPSLILHGLNTYIHPDDANLTNQTQSSGPKVAIRRPSDQNVNGSSELRNRKKPREKLFEFDETKAQIFRLRLGDAQICSRLYFDSFRSFNCFVVAFTCFLLHKYLILNVGESDNDKDNVDDDYTTSGVLKSGSLVPIVIGVLGFFRVLISLFRVSIERSTFKRSERGLGLVIGALGFFASLVICVGVYPWLFDFEFSSIDGYGKLFVSLLSGFITGFLYLAAGKNARAFWLGTDQIRCNLPIISCGWFSQVIFCAYYLLLGFTSLLWINLFGELLVNKNIDGGRNGVSSSLVGNVGMSEPDFVKFRLLCLLLSGLLQVIALRWYVQTFLNEAVLSWYQRLHASVVPYTEYSRAKVFLHNHYLCLAVIQFFAPAALVLLSLGLSQVDEGLFENFEVACVLLPCSAFVKEVALFLAWWVSFV
ncbi:hypothetical protein SOVF_065260, partial [Spinacia oleracea]